MESVTAYITAAFLSLMPHGEGIVPHPSGCPPIQFCGCGVSVRVFGLLCGTCTPQASGGGFQGPRRGREWWRSGVAGTSPISSAWTATGRRSCTIRIAGIMPRACIVDRWPARRSLIRAAANLALVGSIHAPTVRVLVEHGRIRYADRQCQNMAHVFRYQ
jgi:hypothetical protein